MTNIARDPEADQPPGVQTPRQTWSLRRHELRALFSHWNSPSVGIRFAVNEAPNTIQLCNAHIIPYRDEEYLFEEDFRVQVDLNGRLVVMNNWSGIILLQGNVIDFDFALIHRLMDEIVHKYTN